MKQVCDVSIVARLCLIKFNKIDPVSSLRLVNLVNVSVERWRNRDNPTSFRICIASNNTS